MTSRIKHAVDGIHADMPIVPAARRILKSRFAEVEHYLRLVGNESDGDVENVHQLRVATRRSAAAVRMFRRFSDPGCRQEASQALRRLRRAAGSARQTDVQLTRLRADKPDTPGGLTVAYDACLSELIRARRRSQKKVDRVARQKSRAGIRRVRERLLRSLHHPQWNGRSTDGTSIADVPLYNLRELAAVELPPLAARVLDAASGDLSELASVHQLRLRSKKLRYGLELLGGCLLDNVGADAYGFLERLQEQLGELNDLHDIAERIATRVSAGSERNGHPGQDPHASMHVGWQLLQARFGNQLEQRHRAFVEWFVQHRGRAMLEQLLRAVRANAGPAGRLSSGTDELRSRSSNHRRVAAIDVGTNSVRLVIAESDPSVRFRIIEDVKETTRLGSGVYTAGRLQPAAMEATVAALARMQAVAAARKVEQLRAVGTSAVREAQNRAEFLEMALRRTGIDVEVLDARSEARLAFSSVANSFDLDDRCVAVADIGGGSTELVLSRGGVIESIHPLPLGAVRLTELYGSRKNGDRYDEMLKAVGRVLSERLHPAAQRPYLILGTGGTFTSLAKVAIHCGTTAGVRFPFELKGYEFRRAEVTRLLDWLRGMPLEARRAVPGLSSDRAEIIVAGVCIIERLMQFFGVERLRVHDGGIRDGLLSHMFDEMGIRPASPRVHGPDTIEAVRRFAQRCEYDAGHCEHVAFLSLRIFDQLAEQELDPSGAWSRLGHRTLLHAAGLLHDVGTMVEFRRHQRHSYDLVMHADLPELTRREVEIVANICRYHRRGGPKRSHPNFRRLSDDDQRLVAHLAGILRIADGLDRVHERNVSDVNVRLGDHEVIFDALGPVEPRDELRHARRKADVLEAAFRTHVHLTWRPPEACTAPDPEILGAAL